MIQVMWSSSVSLHFEHRRSAAPKMVSVQDLCGYKKYFEEASMQFDHQIILIKSSSTDESPSSELSVGDFRPKKDYPPVINGKWTC